MNFFIFDFNVVFLKSLGSFYQPRIFVFSMFLFFTTHGLMAQNNLSNSRTKNDSENKENSINPQKLFTTPPCNDGFEPCGNMILNGSLAHRVQPCPNPDTVNTFRSDLCVWQEVPAGVTESEYLSLGFNDNSGNIDAYSYYALHPYINGVNYSANFNMAPYDSLYFFANDGFIGIETGPGSSDILKTEIFPALNPGDYYLSYYVSPGDECKLYFDRIDAAVSSANYTPQLPITLASGVVDNYSVVGNASWSLISTVFTAVGGEDKLFLGNILGGNPTDTIIGNPQATLNGFYYFVDNAFLAPWKLDLGPDINCAADSLTIGDVCYFPGVQYEWFVEGDTLVIGQQSQLVVSPIITSNYVLRITAFSPDNNIAGVLMDTISVTPTLNNLLVVAPTAVNYGASASITASGAIQYLFILNGDTTANFNGQFNIDSVFSNQYFQIIGFDSLNCPVIFTDSIMVVFPLGFSGENNLDCNVFPNPSNGSIRIESDNPITELRLMNFLGQNEIFQYRTRNLNQAEISFSRSPAGIYFLEIFFTDGSRTIRRCSKQE